MPTEVVSPSQNGAVNHEEERIVVELRASIETRRSRVAELRAEIDEIMPALKRYERALQLLTGDEPENRGPGRPTGGKPSKYKPISQQVAEGKGISVERLNTIVETIYELIEDRDEFRQVDVRTKLDIPSNVASLAFEALRQKGVIRLARAEGNNKWYRLTREALVEREAPQP